MSGPPPVGGDVGSFPNPLVGVPRFQQRDSVQLAQRVLIDQRNVDGSHQARHAQGSKWRRPNSWRTPNRLGPLADRHCPPPRQVAVNDPWGEPDLMHGTFAASEAVRCWEPSRGPTEMVMDEKKENEHQENLAFSDNDTIDFEQLRRDLTPDQRLQLVVILLQL